MLAMVFNKPLCKSAYTLMYKGLEMSKSGDQLRRDIEETQGKASKGDKRIPVEVSPDIHAALKSLAAREGTSMKMLTLEGLAHVFDKYGD